MIFDVPRITTSLRDSITPVNSSVIYNTDNNRYEYYNGTSWKPFGEGGVISFNTRTGEVTLLDSDIASLGDFTISGTVTINNDIILGSQALKISTASIDPNVSGVSANVGSIILRNDGSIWQKLDTGNTDWSQVQTAEFTNEPTGFPVDINGQVDRTSSTISFNNGSRTFSITPSGTSFTVLIKGRQYRKTTTEIHQITISEGLHYIYYDNDCALQSTTSFSLDLILKYAFVSIIYWDATNNEAIIFSDERHGCTMDSHTHARIHAESGSVYVSGMAAFDFSVDGDGSSENHLTYSINSGTMRDEDIFHTLSQKLTTATVPIFYRDGVNWRRAIPSAVSGVYARAIGTSGTPDQIAYNNFDGSVWSRASVLNNNFVCYHVIGTNDVNYPYILIMGINQYTTKPLAQAAAITEISSLSGLPFVEMVFIGTILFECKTSYSNSLKARIVSANNANYIDWRFKTTLNPATANINTHNNLGGLYGDFPYYHSNQPISNTDSPTFSGLTVNGNLYVSGTTTTINTVNLQVKDKNIELAISDSPSDAIADGGGITLKGTTDKTLNWVDFTDSWTSSEHIDLASNKVYKISGATVLSATQVLGKNVPTGDIVGTTDTQNLSNKTIDGFVLNGDINSTLYASDVDLIDNNSSAISFDSSGKAGILEIDTTNNFEQVKMSGGLSVTGTSNLKNVTASGTIVLNGLTYPVSGGTNGQVITSDGSGNLSFSTITQNHNQLTNIQGGDGTNYYHSNQPINTTDSVIFNGISSTSNLNVTGTSTQSTINMTTGNVSGALNVTGTSTQSTVNMTTGNVSGTLNVTGTSTLATTNMTTSNVSGALNVTGTSTQSTVNMTAGNVSGALNVTGTSTQSTVNMTTGNVSGALNVTGASTLATTNMTAGNVSGALNVTGTSTQSTVNMTTGNVSGALNVTGASTLATTNMTIGNVSGALNVTGTSTQSTVNLTTGNVSGTLTFADNNTSGAILNQVKFLTEINSTVSGTINNVSNSKSSIRFAPTGLLTITGFSAILTDPVNVNEILSILNSGTADIILSNESTSSTASSRITTGTGSNFTLKPGSGTLLHYDIISTRWRIIGGASSGGSSSNETTVSLNSGSSLNINSSQVFTSYVDGNYDFMVVSDPTISFQLFIKNGTPPDATIITSSNLILDSDESGYLCVYISGNNLVLKNNLGYNISLKVSRVTTA